MTSGETVQRTIICETDRLRVIAQETGSPTVFVSFNELGLLKTQDFFWGHEFFAREGISSVGITTTEPNWYPPSEMVGAVEAIRRAVRGRRVITYGHSQGGYGAIKFSAALEAAAAVAFCPQWSIAPPAVASFDPRYTAFHRAAWCNGLPIGCEDIAGRAYVLFDPLDAIDSRHVEMIGTVTDVVRIPVPLSGHETVRLVTESGSSADFIHLFCGDSLPAAAQLRGIMRDARRRSRTYSNNLLSAVAHAPERSRRMLGRALASLSGSTTALARTVHALRAGDNVAAAAALRDCSESDMLRFGAVRLWRIFRDASFIAGELRLADILPRHFPDDAFLRLHAVNSLIEGERREEARQELLTILAQTDWLPHAQHICTFARSLARADH